MVKKTAEMKPSVRAALDAAIEAGTEPKQNRRQSGRLMLHLGNRKYLTLADSRGKLSANGRYFFSKSGREPPVSGFDPNTKVIKRGPTEFIRMLNGEEKQIRRWDAGKSDFNYTQLGCEYFKQDGLS